MPAGFQDIEKAGDVAVEVGVGVFQGVTHTRLGRQIDHHIELFALKQCVNALPIGQLLLLECEPRLAAKLT